MNNFGQSNGSFFNQDKYEIYIGRLATLSALIGLIIGIITSYISNFSWIGSIMTTAFLFYLFLTGFWGAYKINLWYRKFKYRLPTIIWKIGRGPVMLIGILAGWTVWGLLEHLLLIFAMRADGKPGTIVSQLILTPIIGSWVADKINYKPSEVEGSFKK
jgi:hypothetical protein